MRKLDCIQTENLCESNLENLHITYFQDLHFCVLLLRVAQAWYNTTIIVVGIFRQDLPAILQFVCSEIDALVSSKKKKKKNT